MPREDAIATFVLVAPATHIEDVLAVMTCEDLF